MTNVVLLDSAEHRLMRVRTGVHAIHCDEERFVPVTVGEFGQLVTHCPIILTKNARTGEFVAGALLGFDEGENLFRGDPGQFAQFRPLNLQRLPFYVMGGKLAVDLDSPRITEQGGERIFDDNGKPTSILDHAMTHIRELDVGAEQTRSFIGALTTRKLLEPIDVSLSFDDGRSLKVEDIFTINRNAISELGDTDIVELFRPGYLQLIYYMIASLRHLSLLAEQKNRMLSVFHHG